MTAADACGLLVDHVRELATTRADRDVWRTIALVAISHASELTRENDMISSRRYVHRQRNTADHARNYRDRQEAAAA